MSKRPFPAYTGTESFVFVSYAHADSARVYPLLHALRERGVHFWYDEGIEPGSNWRDELTEAIAQSERALFLVSANSVISKNCIKELNFALGRDKQIVLAYLDPVPLPATLEFSLGDEQAVSAAHYEADEFISKLHRALTNARGGVSPLRARAVKKSRTWVAPLLITLGIAGAIVGYQWQQADRSSSTAAVNAAINTEQRNGEPATIAIAPPINLTGDAQYDWLGNGLSNLISDELANSRHVQMVSQVRWENLVKASPDGKGRAAIQAQAKAAGIRYVVSGELLRSPEGLLLSVRTSDLLAGVDVGAQTHDNLQPENLVSISRRIARSIQQSLNLPRERALATLAADFAADDFAAYEAYISGLTFYNDFAFAQAADSMRAALAISPDFHMARFRLANIEITESKLAEAQRTLEQIPPSAELEPRAQAYVDTLQQWLAGDLAAAEQTLTTLLETYPYDIEARLLLAQTYHRQFEDEQAIAILEALGEQEPENHHFWSTLGYLAMVAGDETRAKAAYEQYATLAPERPNPWSLLGSLSLQGNNPETAKGQFARALKIDSAFTPARLGSARAAAQLGDYPTAEALLEQIVNNVDDPPYLRISAAFDRAALRQARGDYSGVATVFDPIDDLLNNERSRFALAQSERGLAALRAGQFEEARTLLNTAVSSAPDEGAATRYLFARGQLEVELEEFESVAVTVAKIRALALPADDPDQTEAKAALQLEALALMKQGETTGAIAKLREASLLGGYQYRLVNSTLARAYELAGDTAQAIATAQIAMQEWPDFLSAEPRLDLEIDRRQAAETGRQAACSAQSESNAALFQQALQRWPSAAPSEC